MRVEGVDVPPAVIERVEQRMRQGGFRAKDLSELSAKEMGISDSSPVANRVADRLIQKHKKADNLRLASVRPFPVWDWCGK